jgi:hypothetical protein
MGEYSDFKPADDFGQGDVGSDAPYTPGMGGMVAMGDDYNESYPTFTPSVPSGYPYGDFEGADKIGCYEGGLGPSWGPREYHEGPIDESFDVIDLQYGAPVYLEPGGMPHQRVGYMHMNVYCDDIDREP